MITAEQLEQIEQSLQHIEGRNRGWIRGGEAPPFLVLLDGKEVRNVLAANRRKGVLRVCHSPAKLDKHKKRLLSYTLKGVVTFKGI